MKDMVVGVANMAANTNNTAIEHLTGNTTIGRLDGTVIVNNNRSARITTVVAIAHDMVVIVVRLVRPFNNSWEALWTISNGATPTIHATHQVIMDRCGTISNNIATITDTIVGRGRNRTSSQLLISTKRKTNVRESRQRTLERRQHKRPNNVLCRIVLMFCSASQIPVLQISL